MYLAGVDGDHVARAGFHHAAAAKRVLGALVDEADAELVVGVADEGMARLRFDRVYARGRAAQHPELTLCHSSADPIASGLLHRPSASRYRPDFANSIGVLSK